MRTERADLEARAYYGRVLSLSPNGKPQQTVRCPFHEDSRRSLSINLTTGLWKCHAGCGSGGRLQFEAKLEGVEPRSEKFKNTKANGVAFRFQDNDSTKPEAIYEYHDASGQIVFRKLRYPEKKFVIQQALRQDGTWKNGLEGISTRPLYNLRAVKAAKNIVIAEGEKDCDRLHKLFRKLCMKGWVATTNFDGAKGTWREGYAECLAGKNIVMIPDNDDAGRRHAEDFARNAALVAARVCLLTLPNLPDKGDVSDYLEQHTDEELRAQLEKVTPWNDPVMSLFQTAAEFASQVPEKAPWIVEGFVAKGMVTQLIAKNKMGKSTFTHYMIRTLLQGELFLDRRTFPTPVVYLTEMPETDLRAELKDCPGLLERADLHILLWHRAMGLSWPEVVNAAILKCKVTGAKLLIVDTFSVWTRIKDENSASDTIAAFEPLQRAVGEGIGVWIESHERKSGGELSDAGRGSSALAGLVSTVITLRRPTGGNHPETYRHVEAVGRHGRFSNVVNWNGADYVFLGTKSAVATEEAHKKLISLLPGTENEALPFKELQQRTGVSRTVLQRELASLCQSGFVHRKGTSSKSNPYRYYLVHPAAYSGTPTSKGLVHSLRAPAETRKRKFAV